MARDHARIYTSIWNDPHWRALDQAAQHTYWSVMSQPRLSYCGALDYFPGRLAQLAAGLTEARVKAGVRSLEKSRFLVVDRQTHEVLVRSYVRHDGVLKRRNMGNAVARALGNVVSQTLRDAVIHELARLLNEDKTLAGWDGFKDFDPIAFDMTCAIACDMESGDPIG